MEREYKVGNLPISATTLDMLTRQYRAYYRTSEYDYMCQSCIIWRALDARFAVIIADLGYSNVFDWYSAPEENFARAEMLKRMSPPLLPGKKRIRLHFETVLKPYTDHETFLQSYNNGLEVYFPADMYEALRKLQEFLHAIESVKFPETPEEDAQSLACILEAAVVWVST